MQITNNTGLPESVVRLVSPDDYEKHGPKVVSVTSLTRPAQQIALEHLHGDLLVEDAADRVWATYGKLMHLALEKMAPEDAIKEERFWMGPYTDDWVVTGQPDLYHDNVLSDFKFVSVWSFMDGVKPEYTFQLNAYAELMRSHGHQVDALQVVAFYRDWSKTRIHDRGYPQQQAEVHHVSLWPREFIQAEIERLVGVYANAVKGIYEPCTPEERWHRDDTYAVTRKGNKKAARLLPSMEEAVAWANENGGAGMFDIGLRPGADARCDNYCAVAQFCLQYGEKQEAERQEA